MIKTHTAHHTFKVHYDIDAHFTHAPTQIVYKNNDYITGSVFTCTVRWAK